MAESKVQNYKDLNDFLIKHKRKGEQEFTHTRIGDTERGVYPGSYCIPDEELDVFWKLYYKAVFINKKPEYLTERQDRINGGPLLVDIDMRFEESVTTRKFNVDHLSDILELYGDAIQNVIKSEQEYTFDAYVFQKGNVVAKKGKETKDGLHIIFGLSMHHSIQLIIRDVVINLEETERQIFTDLECVNSVNDIFDECISIGRNNWQVWGSGKPGCDTYKLVSIWEYTINDDQVSVEQKVNAINNEINIKELLPIVSAKNKNFPVKNKVKDEFEEKLKEKLKATQVKKNKKKKKTVNNSSSLTLQKNIKLNSNLIVPKNQDELEVMVKNLHSSLDIKDVKIEELHNLTMILDERWYDPYKQWLEIGWALHNTDSNLLFWTWVSFSAKSSKFDFNEIPKMWEMWNCNFKDEGITFRTIHYHVKENFPTEYFKIQGSCTDKLITECGKSKGSDTDLAIITNHLFKELFACVGIKTQKWYRFQNHRWVEDDNGTTLRRKLSDKINQLFTVRSLEEKYKGAQEEITEAEKAKHIDNSAEFVRIAIKLKSATQKTSIMKECAERFWDEELEGKLDSNPYLLGFQNGVYDFKQKMFRDGIAEDYISLSTGTNYRPFDPNDEEQVRLKEELDDFFFKIFPNEELRRYMWDHAAAALIGINTHQSFNVYTGGGGNGKSMFVDLMNMVLGSYSDKCNISLITQKRKGIGGPTPEIAKLKGKRYVSMDEPSKGDELNEGIMKQLTGGDEIEGRGMYEKKMVKFIPQFTLVCSTNNPFEIKSNDQGTWRRIKNVPYNAEFVDPEVMENKIASGLTNDPENPIYLKDGKLKDKMKTWVPVFTALLIEKCNENEGYVKDCDIVLASTKAYREKEDFYSQFFKENVTKASSKDKIKKQEIRDRFNEWYQNEYSAKPPKAVDLYEYLNKACGKFRNRGWWGYKIVYDAYDSESDEEESN